MPILEVIAETLILFSTLAYLTKRKILSLIFTAMPAAFLYYATTKATTLSKALETIYDESGIFNLVGLTVSTLIIVGGGAFLRYGLGKKEKMPWELSIVIFLFPMFALPNIILLHNLVPYIIYPIFPAIIVYQMAETEAVMKIAQSDKL